MEKRILENDVIYDIHRKEWSTDRSQFGGHAPDVTRFDSVGEFVSFVRKDCDPKTYRFPRGYGGSVTDSMRPDKKDMYHWTGGISGWEALDYAMSGLPAVTRQMKDFTDQIKTKLSDFGLTKQAFIPAVSGARVVVPDALAGRPLCMRKPIRKGGKSVSVYIELICSAGIDASDLVRRGCVIVAFLELLQSAGVAVDLHVVMGCSTLGNGDRPGYNRRGFTYGRTCYQVVRIGASPLDMAQAGFVIAHPSFIRGVMYDYGAMINGWDGGWPAEHDHGRNDQEYSALTAKRLGLGPHDLYLGPISLLEPLLQKPAEWIEKAFYQVVNSEGTDQ